MDLLLLVFLDLIDFLFSALANALRNAHSNAILSQPHAVWATALPPIHTLSTFIRQSKVDNYSDIEDLKDSDSIMSWNSLSPQPLLKEGDLAESQPTPLQCVTAKNISSTSLASFPPCPLTTTIPYSHCSHSLFLLTPPGRN